jgi:membrane associated rhomboid family serine protease
MAVPQPMRIDGDDRSQPPPPIWAQMRWWSTTYWLIAINVAVYVVDLLSRGLLSQWGQFSADLALFHFQLWRLITYNFLHASPEHLFFNMIALWAFGPPVEVILKRRRYLSFYLICGLGGVAGYLLLWRLQFLDVSRDTELVGASACIFGVIIAAATMSPNPHHPHDLATGADAIQNVGVESDRHRRAGDRIQGRQRRRSGRPSRWCAGGLCADPQSALVLGGGPGAQTPEVLETGRSEQQFLPAGCLRDGNVARFFDTVH